eukprot:6175814-Pleurochrysis_carterae.AAC.3
MWMEQVHSDGSNKRKPNGRTRSFAANVHARQPKAPRENYQGCDDTASAFIRATTSNVGRKAQGLLQITMAAQHLPRSERCVFRRLSRRHRAPRIVAPLCRLARQGHRREQEERHGAECEVEHRHEPKRVRRRRGPPTRSSLTLSSHGPHLIRISCSAPFPPHQALETVGAAVARVADIARFHIGRKRRAAARFGDAAPRERARGPEPAVDA